MDIVYDKIAIDNCWTVVVRLSDKQERTSVSLAFVTDAIAKMLKMQHILLIKDSPEGGGLPPRDLH